MKTLHQEKIGSARAHRLAAALSLALLSHGATGLASGHHPHIPQPFVVRNCDDSGPDSLRDIIGMQAQSGDVVDLSELPVRCANVDSVITLTSGEISILQSDLVLIGPTKGTVTISGGHASRVLHHTGAGTLWLYSLHIADGESHTAAQVQGGCIESNGSDLRLYDSMVAGCTAISDTAYALGGGIGTLGSLKLTRTVVSGNAARGSAASALGGGAFAMGGITTVESIVRDNSLDGAPGFITMGGGLFASSGASISGSTIAGNSSLYAAAVFAGAGQTTITNSTVSGNTSTGPDALRFVNADAVTISNSTIAFNTMANTGHSGAIYFDGVSIASALKLQSSIVAMNTAGPNNADIFLYAGTIDPNGKNNLIMGSNLVAPPAGVITVMNDPKLGPLQSNGGWTPTHQLAADSPARNLGDDLAALDFDQRGKGYPRTGTSSTDIGAVQFDAIFVDGLDD